MTSRKDIESKPLQEDTELKLTPVEVDGVERNMYSSVFLNAQEYVDVRLLKDRHNTKAARSLFEADKKSLTNVSNGKKIRRFWNDLQTELIDEWENKALADQRYKEIEVVTQDAIKKALQQVNKGKALSYHQIEDMYEHQMFEGYFKEEFIELLKLGYMPNGCSIHHMIPLALEGENDFYNYMLIPGPLHRILHKLLLDDTLPKEMTQPYIIFRAPVMSSVIFCKEHLY